MSNTNNFFASQFDEATLIKLLIFEKYVESWLPVFLKDKVDYIYIFDFFSGPGYDSKGNPGSPLRILNKIKYHLININKTKIKLFFNDCDNMHFENLKDNCEKYLNNNIDVRKVTQIEYYNKKFDEIFNELQIQIGKYPSLVLMDQFGIKYSKYIPEFEKFNKTDFLLFISSSSLRRFAKTQEFQNALNLKKDDIEKFKNTPYKLIHKAVIDFFKNKLTPNSQLKLYPFSLKKDANIYGLIFGTKHILAVVKFLNIIWKINPINGSANYDIYDDYDKNKPCLFPELVEKTTLQHFQEELEKYVLNKNIKTNKEAFYYTLENGYLPKHASEVLKKLKKEGKISYKTRTPLITYENIFKKGKIITYEINKTNISSITKKTLLYKTKVEYGNWTINHIIGCKHGCKFPCYAMKMAERFGWVKDDEDWRKPRIVKNALELLEKEIPKYKDQIDFVHLCFMSDPFMYDFEKKQSIPEIKDLTLKIIEKLNSEGIKVTTLTKGIYPEDILDKKKFLQNNEYGITLVSLNDKFKEQFEPFSAPYNVRIDSLKKLSQEGLNTWVSMEPYPTPKLDETAENIEKILESIGFVQKIIFGKLNYNRLINCESNSSSAWKNNEEFYKEMVMKVINFCKKNDIKYHIKSGTPLSKTNTINIFKEQNKLNN